MDRATPLTAPRGPTHTHTEVFTLGHVQHVDSSYFFYFIFFSPSEPLHLKCVRQQSSTLPSPPRSPFVPLLTLPLRKGPPLRNCTRFPSCTLTAQVKELAEQPLSVTVKCATEESAHSPMRTLTFELWRTLLCVCVCVSVCKLLFFSEVSLYHAQSEQPACVFLITQRHFSTKG